MTLARFFLTPKGQCVLLLVGLAIPATMSLGAATRIGLIVLGASVVGATLVDVPLLRMTKGRWVFPDGALITGLIVGMVLSPYVTWYAAAITAAVGVIPKYLVRIRTANVFNPAALGLVLTFYPFHMGHSWWGALPEAPPYALLLLIAAGVYMTVKVNKVAAMLVFLGVYFLLFTVASFVGDPAQLVGIYRAPDLQATLYFAFFMLTDPPTAPPKVRDQVIFASIVAVASVGVYEWTGAAYFLPAGLLVGNAWEAWRRRRSRHTALAEPSPFQSP